MIDQCCCRHHDARACYLSRYPECNRFSDDDSSFYWDTMDDECECSCHYVECPGCGYDELDCRCDEDWP